MPALSHRSSSAPWPNLCESRSLLTAQCTQPRPQQPHDARRAAALTPLDRLDPATRTGTEPPVVPAAALHAPACLRRLDRLRSACQVPPSSWGTNTWSLFARQGGESLQPGHSWSDRSNSSDTDFEGQIGHRQPGHSGTETCCVSAPGRRRVTKCQDTSSASATTFRAATFWRGNVSHSRRALAHGCARSRSTLGVGCVCTQPTTAFKPKTLYNLICRRAARAGGYPRIRMQNTEYIYQRNHLAYKDTI